MGDITVEVELFKDGLPIENGDFNTYTLGNYSGAIYSAEDAFHEGEADEATFYVDDGTDNPELIGVTKEDFDKAEISEKIEKIISHFGD